VYKALNILRTWLLIGERLACTLYKGKGDGSGFIQRLYYSTSHSKRSGTYHTMLPANYTVPASTS